MTWKTIFRGLRERKRDPLVGCGSLGGHARSVAAATGDLARVRLIFVLLMLASCSQEPYWVKVRDPVLLLELREVDNPCGRTDWDGCAIWGEQRIEIRRGLSPARRQCVLQHERKHFDGYDHAKTWPNWIENCGEDK